MYGISHIRLAGLGPGAPFSQRRKIQIIVLLQNYLHALKHEIIKHNIYVKYDPPMPPKRTQIN